MNEQKDCSSICLLKLENYEKNIEQIQKNHEKLEERMKVVETNMNKLDNELTIKFIKLESSIEMYNKLTSDKIETFAKDIKELNNQVEKKLDKALEENKTSKEDDTNKKDAFLTWVQKLGMKILEIAVYAGIIYAVLSNIFKP